MKRKRILLTLLLMLTCIGCDQVTKSVARTHLRDGETRSIAGDTVRLEYAENAGAFLSLGATLPKAWRTALFTAGIGAVLAGLLAVTLLGPTADATLQLPLTLVCAGGIGNLIDRLQTGGTVIDFLNLGVGGLRTGIFNVADVAITLGAAWLLVLTLRRRGAGPLEDRASR